ncbi:hypothetical protein ACIQOU_05610 [Streptomyces sp. NPDC091279]|uniref:hypothetical protein n=1 Tax=unclassified Streptomyces TaxID=2593676 RepID=UPI00380FDE22
MLNEAELDAQVAGLLPSREALGVLKFHCTTPAHHGVTCAPPVHHHPEPGGHGHHGHHHHAPVHHLPVHHAPGHHAPVHHAPTHHAPGHHGHPQR